jgi:hypothetical protein
MKFQVVIEEDLEDGGYVVHCPALKGCWSQGDTVLTILASNNLFTFSPYSTYCRLKYS